MKRDVTIHTSTNMEATPIAQLVQLANKFTSRVYFVVNARKVNGKSIMGLMMLAASMGSVVKIKTFGIDEEAAMDALCNLIEEKFGEGE